MILFNNLMFKDNLESVAAERLALEEENYYNKVYFDFWKEFSIIDIFSLVLELNWGVLIRDKRP